jgi:5-methylcytosine-specific restriction endonuclease McrBC regulatory subunit McrC
MKKIFKLTDEKKHEDRVLEAVKHEIRKYVKREKKKKLEDAQTTYWDFDCKVGATPDTAKVVDFDELIKALDTVKSTGAKECYVEILAKVVNKPLKEEVESMEDENN